MVQLPDQAVDGALQFEMVCCLEFLVLHSGDHGRDVVGLGVWSDEFCTAKHSMLRSLFRRG